MISLTTFLTQIPQLIGSKKNSATISLQNIETALRTDDMQEMKEAAMILKLQAGIFPFQRETCLALACLYDKQGETDNAKQAVQQACTCESKKIALSIIAQRELLGIKEKYAA